MPRLAGPLAVARRVPLPAVRERRGVGDIARPLDVPGLWPPDIGHGGHDLSPQPLSLAHLVRGGLKERIVRNSPYGTAVSEKARKQADAARDKFMSGTFVIYKGPIKDNAGKTVIAAGESHGQTDVWLESMNWLVEGVIGSTTG